MMRFGDFVALALAAGVLFSCQHPEDVPSPTPVPTPTKDEITISGDVDLNPVLPPEGGQAVIPFKASGAWTAEVTKTRADSWVTVSPSGGSAGDAAITISVSANDLDVERGATVKLTSGTANRSIELTQKQKDVKSPAFDETKIVSSFACLSDCHVDGYDTAPGQKFKNALLQLKSKALEQDSDGLDGVFVAGDLINNAYTNKARYDQMDSYRKIYEEVFNPKEVPMVYTPGNHDTYGQWSSGTSAEAKNLSSRLGADYFITDLDAEARESMECRHCEVDRYHVLCVVPSSSGPVSYPGDVITWLDRTLGDVTSKYPEKYVFVLTHPMIYDTVYGSLLGPEWYYGSCSDYWYTKALTAVLRKYPQAITFSGHLHFPINDPRSIWQGDFTALGCGSVRYMAIEDGKYEDMSSATVMADANDVSSGLLCQLDANGNMRITRMFFSQNTTFGEPWTISYPRADKSHLRKYNHSALKAANTAPRLSTLEVEQIDNTPTSKVVYAKFAAAGDDMFAHHYVLTLKKGGAVVSTRRILADFYRCAQPSQMKSSWTRSLGPLVSGDYELSLVAFDSWDCQSNEVNTSFTVEAGQVTPSAPAEVYADLDFSNGSVRDIKGKVTCTNRGAAVKSTTVSFGGKSYSVPALVIGSKSQYVLCQFNGISSASEMQILAAKSFCVEAFYVDRAPGPAAHGIVCGTQYGGWGLANRATGSPYFIVGDVSHNNYRNIDAKSPASKSQLTHIMCVYDFPGKKISIYVNGVLDGSETITGPFYPGDGDAFNRFCLGDDIKPGGVAGDFPATDMVIVDAKFYTGVMDAAGVRTAYEKAVGALKQD